jgi:beta-xylosidase
VFSTGAYQNPVYPAAAAPDPFVLDNDAAHGDYWAFTTGDLFPVLHSRDLVNWTSAGTAFTSRPAWVLKSGDWHPWAPSVTQLPTACPNTASGPCYVMYYVGLSSALNYNCIGVAVATAPAGPYTDLGPLGPSNSAGVPIGCGDDAGMGNIDPSPFTDANGQAYLYVSTDKACANGTCQLQPTISVIPLTPDRLHASAARIPLFAGTPGSWEGAGLTVPVVEGPAAMLHGGTYYVLYSGGSYTGAYGMGYATAPAPTGPFTKAASNPILAQTATVYSPGGGDLVVTGPHGGTWMVYHGREGSSTAVRTLRIDPFSWTASGGAAPDVPTISGPTDTPQPVGP